MADALRDELLDDPEGRGYAGMSNQEATDELNSIWADPDTRTRNVLSMTGDEIAQAADPTEFDALDDGSVASTADIKSHWLALCGRTSIDPFGVANVALVVSIFGNPSATVTNLLAVRVEDITRADELELGTVKSRDVGYARGTS